MHVNVSVYTDRTIILHCLHSIIFIAFIEINPYYQKNTSMSSSFISSTSCEGSLTNDDPSFLDAPFHDDDISVPLTISDSTPKSNSTDNTVASQNPPNDLLQDPPNDLLQDPPNDLLQDPPNDLLQDPPNDSLPDPLNNSSPDPPNDSSPDPPNDSLPDPPNDSLPDPPNDSLPDPPNDSSPEPPSNSLPNPPNNSSPDPPNDSLPDPPNGSLLHPLINNTSKEPPANSKKAKQKRKLTYFMTTYTKVKCSLKKERKKLISYAEGQLMIVVKTFFVTLLIPIAFI